MMRPAHQWVNRRNLPWALLAVVLIGVVVWTALPSSDRTPGERASELSSELRCPDCEGLSVADSSTSTARAIKVEIRQRIERGESDAAIRQAYVDRYGKSILLKPDGGGIGVIVWGLPAVAVLLGAGGLVLAMRRWRAEPRLHATAADEALVERARSRDVGSLDGGSQDVGSLDVGSRP